MRDLHFPGRSVVMSNHAMVATSQPMATASALQVLREGGNAMDAAVTAAATLAVTEPQSTGLGGDCFILYHDNGTNVLYGLNGSGRAPTGATYDAYVDRGYKGMPETGLHSSMVPGTVDAWVSALEKFGTKPLSTLLAPAIDYAENGFAVTPVVGQVWAKTESRLARFPYSARALLVNGKAPKVGSIHRQLDLADSLKLIAEHGADVFYRGPIAKEIVRYSKLNDGFFELDDFAKHSSTWVEPISADYRGLKVCELPPNGQGVTALMILNILEHVDFSKVDRLSAKHIHLFSEAYKLALIERDMFVGDPEFNTVPTPQMLSKTFGESQYRRIDYSKALKHPIQSGLGPKETVYISVVDAARNCASFINSTCHNWGSGVVAGRSGVVLQNRAVCFTLQKGHPNCVAPSKRAMHTIIPAMVYSDSRPILCFGVMGGHYQPMGHAYVLSNWFDYGLDLQESVDAPRFQPIEHKLGIERGIDESVRSVLREMGHELEVQDAPFGGAQCIFIDWENDVLQASSEPRKDGCALGY